MAAAPIRIRLCGPLRVEVGDEHREDQLRGRQRMLLFTHLVLHRTRPVRRDELLEAIRPGDGAAPGPAVLAPVLSRLRTVIAPARLDGRGTVNLVLPPDAWVDVEAAADALRRAQRAAGAGDWPTALDLARQAREWTAGGLAPGLEADWLDEHRAAVDDLGVEALELAARAAAALGGALLPEAEQHARAAVAAAPFRESARAALITVLRARGNTAEALRAFDEVRVLLRDELGVDPGPALLALHEDLLRPGPAARAAQPGARPPAPLPAPLPAAPRGGGLEDREDELTALDALLESARAGEGRVVVIEGPAGLGKSRLLAELRARARDDGVLLLDARAGQLEQDFPYGVTRQLLEPAVASGAITDQALAGSPAGPVLRDGEAAAPGADGVAVLLALHGLVRALAAQRPVVLCVDDLQWCDRPTLRLLAYLARRIAGTGVLVAATLRTGEPGGHHVEIATLSDDPESVVLRPAPLAEEAVARLVARRLHAEPDTAFVAACHEVTGGNPLLVDRLLGALAADRALPDAEHVAVVRTLGSRAVSRSVVSRLARLTPHATAVARAVAVLGDRADTAVVAELAGIDEADAAGAAGVLVRAEVLRPDGELGFVHPLVADAVHHDLPAPERDLAHRRAARILAARSSGADRVAAHLLQVAGRGDPWAVERLRGAARLALSRGAPDGAARYLDRALAEPPAADVLGEVLLELGRAEGATRGPRSIEHLRAAVDALGDVDLRAEAAFDLARSLLYSGAADEGQELALRTREALPPERSDLRDALQAVAVYAPSAGARRTVPAAPPGTVLHRGGAMLTAAAALDEAIAGARPAVAVDRARRALAVDALLDRDNPFWVSATTVLVLADLFDEASDALDRALAHATRRGSPLTAFAVDAWRGLVLLRTGRPDRAQEVLDRVVADADEWGSAAPPVLSQPIAYLAEALLECDDPQGAATALDATPLPPGAAIGTRLVLTARGEVLLAQGRPADALAVAERIAGFPRTFENPNSVAWRSLLARALAAAGRRDEALAVAATDVDRARRWGAPSGVGRTLRVLGELQGASGLPALREAEAVLAGSAARLEHAKAVAALAGAVPGPERAALRAEALTAAEACGATRLARRLRTVDGP